MPVRRPWQAAHGGTCTQAVLQQGKKVAKQSPDFKADVAAFEARMLELSEEAAAQLPDQVTCPGTSAQQQTLCNAMSWGRNNMRIAIT